MGGEGSGRRPSEETIVKRFTEQNQPTPSVSNAFILPNLSGVKDAIINNPLVNITTDDIIEGVTNLYDKTLSLTEGTNITISGSYPNFTISASGSAGLWEVDGSETQLITADEIDMQSHKIINLTDPSNDQDAATKLYVDEALGADVTIYKATFDITSNTSVIAAAGAGVKNKVVAISMHNNDTTGTNDTIVKVTDGNGGTVLIGGSTGAIYLVGRGGFFGLPMSAAHPYCETTANTALYINPVSGKRIAGAVWYIQEA